MSCIHSRAGRASPFLACAAVILGCALPVDGASFQASRATGPDQLFLQPILEFAFEYPSFSASLESAAPAYKDGSAFAILSDVELFDLMEGGQGNHSESGMAGVRQFILLVILVGAVVRYLTSDSFYAWAADVFGPFGGY